MNLVYGLMSKNERASVSVNFGLIQRLSASDPSTKDDSLSLNCKGQARPASKLARRYQDQGTLAQGHSRPETVVFKTLDVSLPDVIGNKQAHVTGNHDM